MFQVQAPIRLKSFKDQYLESLINPKDKPWQMKLFTKQKKKIFLDHVTTLKNLRDHKQHNPLKLKVNLKEKKIIIFMKFSTKQILHLELDSILFQLLIPNMFQLLACKKTSNSEHQKRKQEKQLVEIRRVQFYLELLSGYRSKV